YKTHQIQKGIARQYHPFVFNDVMGLEGIRGVREEDIKHAMQGHLKEGYKFNAKSPLQPSDEGYNKNPDRNDMVDILVCVVSANALPMMKDDTLNKMNVITTAARDYDIPQMAILTNIDETCPLVKKSITNVYKSKRIRRMMEELQMTLQWMLRDRLNKCQFEQLLRIVAPSIAKLDTKFRQAISPEDGSAFVYGTWQQEILSGLLRFASGWVPALRLE
ncbi:unnamed protein product, partial [Gadus morhua 'NCC']